LRVTALCLWSAAFQWGREVHAKTPSLDAVRARIDAVDAELLRLVDERAGLAHAAGEAKRAAGGSGKFGLRPGRETLLLRKLLATPRQSAGAQLTVRLWREFISDSLAQQGPFHLAVWGGPDPARVVELARARFGAAPPLNRFAKPEAALAEAKTPGGVAILALTHDSAWWGRLLAEPRLAVFASLPCLLTAGAQAALAVGEVEVEPTGGDETYWVTDAAESAARIEMDLARDGVAARLIVETGGLKLFGLAGFYQRDDARLARAPGRLSGVIGAAPTPLDL
jgi:chorismate mutase